MQEKMFKKNNGITLIALVITIIVMLILVAVTITMAVNGGLFKYAGNAVHDTEQKKQEELKLAEGKVEVDGKKYDSPEDFIDGVKSGLPPKYKAGLLDENGVLTKNAIYTDTNNETVEIPKGFKVSSDSSENTKAGGLVIQDKDDNEFVWIPVEYETAGEPDENGLYTGFLSVFKRSAWSSNARDTVNELSSNYTEPCASGYEGEDTEYYAMMKSVQDHKGFFIGRYEAGSSTPRTVSSGAPTPIIKQDAYPYNYVKWGNGMASVGTTGAVYLSKNMYNDSTKYGVVSTLCYGVQWDAMLDFIKDVNHNVTSSVDWGNYSDTNADKWTITRTTAQYYKNNQWNEITEELTKKVAGSVLLTTGANENFKAKNIYDVAGNVSEWIMEADTTSYRVLRGGYYFSSSAYSTATNRGHDYPTRIDGSIIGFRPTLYIK